MQIAFRTSVDGQRDIETIPAAGGARLKATDEAVPGFERHFLTRGHAVHFSAPTTADLGPVPPLRVDIMSHMRGVAPFEKLWERRTTIALADPSSTEEILVDLLSLGDLVQAKKTQRDKDWPMLRRLVDASYASARDGEVSDEQMSNDSRRRRQGAAASRP